MDVACCAERGASGGVSQADGRTRGAEQWPTSVLGFLSWWQSVRFPLLYCKIQKGSTKPSIEGI